MKQFINGAKSALGFCASLAGVISVLMLFSIAGERLYAQLQQSGGPGSTVTIGAALPAGTNLIGKVGIDQTTPGTTNKVSIGTDGTVALNTALPVGTNIIGVVRTIPGSCSQTSFFANSTAQVATGAGTTVTSTTTCAIAVYANNITNASVTIRLADRQGTPVIWLGGNADFTIPANSNMKLPVEGVVFTSGITAIAGTASAVNLQIQGLQ